MLNLELPRDAAIPLLGINTQKNGKFMSTQKPVCECTQQPKIVNNPMCNNWWTVKQNTVYPYNGILFCNKKK